MTIYDLAKELRLSGSTVSRGLRDDPRVSERTRKRIKEYAEQMGYRTNFFARTLRNQRTNTIGLLVPDLQRPFAAVLLASVERITAAAGYDLVVAQSGGDRATERLTTQRLFQRSVDGLIAFLADESFDPEHFKLFFENDLPVVLLNVSETGVSYPTVSLDHYACGYKATQHLLSQGCRRIVFVGGALERKPERDRCAGYCDALKQAGRPNTERLLVLDDPGPEASRAAAEKILAMRPRPDGVFITDDLAAAVCMRVFRENHFVVPQSIAVAALRSERLEVLTEPALTTIGFSGSALGEAAAAELVRRLTSPEAVVSPAGTVVGPELRIQESSLKARLHV